MEEKSQAYKLALFVGLTVVTTANIVCVNYSRTKTSGPMYYSTSMVFVTELLKVAISFGLLVVDQKCLLAATRIVRVEIVGAPWDTLKLSIPALIYVVQNNLSFYALGNLDPATYQVTYQIKLLTTALVMRIMLGKVLTSVQWGGLVLLLFGVSLVEVEKIGGGQTAQLPPDRDAMMPLVGFLATIGMTFCSAIAGVYFEMMVKKPAGGVSTSYDVWVRNLQLYFFSTISALLACLLKDGAGIWENGFFYGYNGLVVCVVLVASLGGTMTAMMIKHLDNIYKNFSSSMSIVLASLCAYLFAGEHYGLGFFLGSFLVCFSLFVYYHSGQTAAAKRPIPATFRDPEKA